MPVQSPLSCKSSSSPFRCLTRTRHPVPQSTLLSWQRGKPRALAVQVLYAIIHDQILWLSRPGDPFVHHGRHFGRTVHTMCNIHALICKGIGHLGEEPAPEESLTYELVLVFFFSIASELMHTSKTQGWKRASSVPTTFADYSPP